MLSFSTSVAVNNLLALKAFHTFLFNYGLHESPSWLEKMTIPKLRLWVETKAMFFLGQLQADDEAAKASVTLNDVTSDFFAVLYLLHHPELTVEIDGGKDLFMLLAQMSLEFEKVKKPRTEAGYPNVG